MTQSKQMIDVMRTMYAAALADAVKHMGKAGVLEQVREAKREEQLASGRARAAQLGVTRPDEALPRMSQIFDCADWQVTSTDQGFEAEAHRCTLCGFARRMGAPSPCRIYCLDPLEGIVRGLDPDLRLHVEETLYDGKRCAVRVSPQPT